MMREYRTIAGICAGAAIAGCVSLDRPGDEDFNRYIRFCRETAISAVAEENLNDQMPKDDWMVGAALTTREFNKEYRIIYADRDYLSFYTKEYSYLGGAHGNTVIRVGTISRSTGRILKVGDFVADGKRVALLAALHDGAVKALGDEENLQSEVWITDNFYLAKDGLHFIYNEYEIACYAAGPVEVVIVPESL